MNYQQQIEEKVGLDPQGSQRPKELKEVEHYDYSKLISGFDETFDSQCNEGLSNLTEGE